jgi:PhnB protein
MQIQPCLYFDGRCDEAIEFYRNAVGAKLDFAMRFKECPDPLPPGMVQSMGDKIMHASVRIGESVVLMSDGRCGGKPGFSGITLSLRVSNDADAQRLFTALGDGGTVNMPMSKTFFTSSFGMLTDRLGVSWMVLVHD